MTDVAGNPEEERRAEFYHQPWSQEAVSRYFYCKVCRGLRASGLPSQPLLPTPSAQRCPPGSRWLSQGGWAAGTVLSLTSNSVTLPLLFL